MDQIRYGVFETNSSSMHSLVIRQDDSFAANTDIYFTSKEIQKELSLDENGVYKVYHNDEWYFGRSPFRILSSFEMKMQYAFANEYDYKYDEIFSIVKKYAPNLTKIELPEFIGTDDCQLKSWLDKAKINLEEFLTNKKYVVICDGDEYCLWEQLKQSGIINKNSFTEVRYNYDL